jgi:aerobic carbon-monoxide dehydrogenase large subunit
MPRIGTDERELLVTGRGRFIADIAPDDCVEVCFVRSPVPHAAIRSVDLGSAQATWGPSSGCNP